MHTFCSRSLVEKVQTTHFMCAKCSKRIMDIEVDCDPILLQNRISIFCHGESVIVAQKEIESSNGEIVVFQ